MTRLPLAKLFFCWYVLVGLATPNPSWSAEKNAVSAKTYQVLEQANAWMKAGKAKQAAQKLQSLQVTVKDSPYESAVVQQYLAYAYSEAGNLWAARQAAKAALESKLLSVDAEHGLNFLAGQIALRQENFRESALYLQQWLKRESKADPEIYYMAGYAASRANLPAATQLLEKALYLNNAPPEEWRRLLLSVYVERKQYAKAESIVKTLLIAAPKKREWWRFLSGLYAQQGRHDQALATMMLAYYQGQVYSKDILQLVRFNAHQGYPVKAARMLETELERQRIARNYQNLKLLFSCWQLAREWDKSREVLAEAAKLSTNGEDFSMLGRMEMRQGNWTQAKHCFQKGLRKGRLKRIQHTRLWLGIAALKAQDIDLAKQTLQPLLATSSVKREAAYWLKRLDRSRETKHHGPRS